MFPRVLWLFLSLFFGSIVSLALLVVWWLYGWVIGDEICPHSFQQRRFEYWQPMFFSKGVWKTESQRDAFPIALGLTGAMPTQIHQRWDLVRDNYTSSLSRDLEARFLAELLDRRSESGEFYWVEWSAANVEQAKRFWPLVSRLAVDRFYVIQPDLFLLISIAPPELPAAELEILLTRLIQRQLAELRQEAVAAGLDADVRRLDQALLDYSLPTAE
ncbi:MAG: hypothetical protein Q8M16_08405 [Pirellulaceae bacterium]|nr:hypothetical protein [Pirellulaceae bacterium]